ncbi:Non-repetitive/WGA-negative nucleoporin C-terminal-domain-containing protein [Kalaharituber pfeilii]|nr:Non-repetitive/WGA-negative nucleoporin C-terminal-domain-containing protein [Kalaharituber pfeilii]
MAGGVGDTQVQGQVIVSTENLAPIPRAARTINEVLLMESRYPDLDNIVSQGQSAEYDIQLGTAWSPFKKTHNHHIPDAIFEQYNQAQCHTMMGLFAELGQAWMTVDNRLYLWEYVSGGQFQGFESQPNTITSVRLLKPRPDVFNEQINYVLVIGTSVEMFLIGIGATPNARNACDVVMYDTKMSINIKGLDISVIEGADNGRIFFGGRSDNEVYEFTYKGEEGWFQGRCGKVCHTSQGLTSFAPKIPIPFLTKPQDAEYVVQMVVDNSRSLLYTLSSRSNIRAFLMKQDNTLVPRITHTWAQIRSNVGVMVGESKLIQHTTTIVSISPVPSEVARRTHLVATTSTGCRLYMSAVSSDYGYDSANSMQVVHIRFPPMPPATMTLGREIAINLSPALTPTRKAKIFPPGYFFCLVDSPDRDGDSLFISAPDSAKMSLLAEQGHNRLQLYENGTYLGLESRAEAIEVVSPPFVGGNETCVQFDTPPAEIAILTNSGVQIVKKRRLIEIFAAAIRYGAHGAEAEVRKFFDTYGRAEGCVTALAVACGVDTEVPEHRGGRITDREVVDLARKFFIDFGGKPRAENIYDASTLPSLDSVKLSGRHDGIALYITRIIRSIWKSPIITETRKPGGVSHSSTVSPAKLLAIQEQLQGLAKFLEDNRSFIDGLSGSESLLRVGSRVEEVAQQAEHRALHSLVQLIAAMIEGISFVSVLFDNQVDDIIMSLQEPQKSQVKKMTYEDLFTSAAGNALAKELVTVIVNKNIAAGMDVDTIAEALRRRCGSFCSADDVIIFKAVEQLRKAANEGDPDLKQRMLRESLRLFEQTASSLTMDNLKETVLEFQALGFYQGAVELPLVAAKEFDRGNLALNYINDGAQENDPRAASYKRRQECYQLVFHALDAVDSASTKAPETVDGHLSGPARTRNQTWDLVYTSDDEVFHHDLYDWLFSRGQGGQLLEIDSPFALDYLKRRSLESLGHAELLWQYHARREDYYGAANVLYRLARGDFNLTLEQRLEFLSRARGFCSSAGPAGARQRMTDLSHSIQEELDVAVIQDEVLKRIREDERISEAKKTSLISELDTELITLSDLYNRYAEPYEYMDICLAIFQSADYRGPLEIRKCWETLISQIHEKTVREGQIQPFEAVADTIRRLGHRFSLSEYIFPPTELVPLLEVYALEKQRDIGPPTWVVDSLLDAGVSPEVLLRILDDIFWRNDVPFQHNARKRLVRDAVFVSEKWFSASLKGGRSFAGSNIAGAGFKPDVVVAMLDAYVKSGVELGTERQRLDRLVNEIRRRYP